LADSIIEKIQINNRVSTAEIAKLLGISRDTVKEYIGKLKKSGKLRRHGTARNGYWEII
jgi:ATP-dependent DNA helicase RecG